MTYAVAIQLDTGEEGSAERLDRMTRSLRAELAALDDVESAKLTTAGETPDGVRGAELAEVGALVLGVISKDVLKLVADLVRAWVARGSGRTAKVVINDQVLEVSGLSRSAQKELIDAWLSSLPPPPDG